MMTKRLQVTSLAAIKEQANGEIIELSGWTEEPFVAKVKKVSFLGLVSEGLIPNTLLNAAAVIFNGKTNNKKDSREYVTINITKEEDEIIVNFEEGVSKVELNPKS